MIIAVDVMSGDNTPEEIAKGALNAAKDFGINIVLIGDKDAVSRYEDKENGISVVTSTQVVTMEDDPLSAIKEKTLL